MEHVCIRYFICSSEAEEQLPPVRQRHLSKDSLLFTNEETGKSPNTLVLQRSSCGSAVLVSCLSPLSPGAREKEFVQDGLMALLSCFNSVPAIYPARAHGSSFLSETAVGIQGTSAYIIRLYPLEACLYIHDLAKTVLF